ncbi:unnamed protein product [Rotaria socialis]|uniref:Uncharacterized protein n=1 Tax=Rotaria socialis TaxID=392032 RepID=A0A821PE52_9BILA|nr:unnamed protein product [Rotaria socialis]CAF4805962.1 unnamed protein product [Rotaria socialis]
MKEPPFRLKLTHIVASGELILGARGSHMVGDGASLLKFLNTISRIYQQMEPAEPLPIYERRLWSSDEGDQSLLPMLKYLSDCRLTEEVLKQMMDDQKLCDQVNIHFSDKQLRKLRLLAGFNDITIQDALTAYIILTLNIHCYSNEDPQYILRTSTFVNIRGVSDSIAPAGLVANGIFIMLSDDFVDPLSFSNITKTIRQSIV